jgi:hypothetical protein
MDIKQKKLLADVVSGYISKTTGFNTEPNIVGNFTEYYDQDKNIVCRLRANYDEFTDDYYIDCHVIYDFYISMFKYLNVKTNIFHEIFRIAFSNLTGKNLHQVIPCITSNDLT